MTIAGRRFSRGLGTHANGKLVFNLPEARFSKFLCLVGHDEATLTGGVPRSRCGLTARRLSTGAGRSIAPDLAAKPVEVDVSGAKVLELRTLDGGDGVTSDHADWADARLVK